MPKATFKGVTTKRLYTFAYGFLSGLPAALQDVNGNPITGQATYNGETVVNVNNDGSIARGTASGVPAGADTTSATHPSVYDAYTTPSLWEQD